MEQWQDQGIVLSARAHGENGAVVALLTEHNGRHAGYVHGAQSSKKRAMVEPGCTVSVAWSSRVSDALGTYQMEPDTGLPHGVMDDPLKLGALLSACALCDAALPEREGHPGLFYGLRALIDTLESDVWAASYVMWELALLKELGFGLDLTKCAMNGDPLMLTHVSPKSGRAVSAAQAAPYKEKLLKLPNFLRPSPHPILGVASDHPLPGGEGGAPAKRSEDGEGEGFDEDVFTGLKLTGYFLEHWVFAHHTKGVPEARVRFQDRYGKSLNDLIPGVVGIG
jgi:DNA repair protein RecO (recombination protein O)